MRFLTQTELFFSRGAFAFAALVVASGCASSEPPPAEAPSSYVDETPVSGDETMQPASRDLTGEEGPGNARGPSAIGGERVEQAPALPAETLDDRQIAAINDAANNAEIEQARVAEKRAKNPRVKKFAQMMISHHGQAKKDQAKLVTKLKLTPSESATGGQLAQESANALAQLKDEKENVDYLYITSQVEAHRKVLELLDQRLIPGATSPELAAMLSGFRPKVEAHLTEAMEIQKVLDSEAGANRSGAAGSEKAPGKQMPGAMPAEGTRSGSSDATKMSPKQGPRSGTSP